KSRWHSIFPRLFWAFGPGWSLDRRAARWNAIVSLLLSTVVIVLFSVVASLLLIGPNAPGLVQGLLKRQFASRAVSPPQTQSQPRPKEALARRPAPRPRMAQDPPSLTSAQGQWLSEDSNWAREAREMVRQGRYREAIAAARSCLAVLHHDRGGASPQSAEDIDILAWIHAANQDFAAELEARRERLDA